MNFFKLTILLLFLCILGAFVFAGYFKDVPTNHWAYKQAVALSKLGILKGYPDGTFRGEQQVTRYQLAVALYNLVLYVQEYVTDKTKNLVGVNSLYSLRTEISKIADMASKAYKWSSENTKAIQDLQKALENMKAHSGESSSATDINEILNEIVSLKTEFDSKLQQFDVKYGRELGNMKDKLSEIENKVNGLMSLISENGGSIKGNIKYEDIASLSRKCNSLEIRLSAVEQKLDNFYDKSIALDVYSIRKDIVDLQNEYSTLGKDVKVLFEKLRELEVNKVEVSEYKKDIHEQEELKSKVTDIEQKMEKFQAELNGVKSSIEVLKNEVGSFDSKYFKDEEKIKKEISDLESKVNELSVRTSDLGKKLEEMESKGGNNGVVYSYIFSIALFIVGIGIVWYLKQ